MQGSALHLLWVLARLSRAQLVEVTGSAVSLPLPKQPPRHEQSIANTLEIFSSLCLSEMAPWKWSCCPRCPSLLLGVGPAIDLKYEFVPRKMIITRSQRRGFWHTCVSAAVPGWLQILERPHTPLAHPEGICACRGWFVVLEVPSLMGIFVGCCSRAVCADTAGPGWRETSPCVTAAPILTPQLPVGNLGHTRGPLHISRVLGSRGYPREPLQGLESLGYPREPLQGLGGLGYPREPLQGLGGSGAFMKGLPELLLPPPQLQSCFHWKLPLIGPY